jgi:hypothetical protein
LIRQRLYARIATLCEACVFEQIGNALFEGVARDAEIAPIDQQVLAQGEVGIEIVQLWHHADAGTRFACMRGYREIQQRDSAVVGLCKPQRQTQGGGFARAIGAEQAETFTGREVEINASDGQMAAVGLLQTFD